MARRSGVVCAVLLLVVGACGSSESEEVSSIRVDLDSTGAVRSTRTAEGPDGSLLTIFAGTRIVPSGAGQDHQALGASSSASLSLVKSSSPVELPAGAASLARLRIVLTVDGTSQEAWFLPASSEASDDASEPGARDQGLKLVVPVDDASVNPGTLGVLYLLTSSGDSVQVGSSSLREPGELPPAAANGLSGLTGSEGASSGARRLEFNPSGTGDYAAAGFTPPAGGGEAPGGAFWNQNTIADQGCVVVESVSVCGPSRVERIELIEESTSEILGICWFGDSDVATTGPVPSGSQFWCQRNQDANSGATELTVSSMQANVLGIRAWIVRASDGLPMWEVYVPPAGGVHAPDGAIHADPYQRSEFKFAGYKKLVFTVQDHKGFDFMEEYALQPLRSAGYTTVLNGYEATEPAGFTAEIGVYETLDARVLMEDKVILKKGWRFSDAPDSRRGNLGTYRFLPRLSISATPIFATEHPTSSEKAVSGSIMVTRGTEEVTDAVVTLNGVVVPHSFKGLYDVGDAEVPSLGPGASVTIVATTTNPPDTRTLTFECPQELRITSPEPNSLITPNQDLSVTWSAGIPYDAMRIAGGPMLGNFACYTQATGTTVSSMGHGADFLSLEVGQTSQSLPIDEECRRYLLELQYPGETVKIFEEGALDMGTCSVRHRIWLMGPE